MFFINTSTHSITLPSPNFSDGEGLTDEVIPRRASDGTVRTYVKTKGGRRRLYWDFTLRRIVGLQFRDFIKLFFASQMRITDHHNRSWVGYLTNNPFEFTSGSGKGSSAIRNETVTIRLEFEGVEDA